MLYSENAIVYFNWAISSSDHYVNYIHCVSKNDTEVTHYNFNALQPI